MTAAVVKQLSYLTCMMHDYGVYSTTSTPACRSSPVTRLLFWKQSTIISWGRSREKEAFERLLDQFSTGPVAVVSDSYDIFKACKHIWGDKLKDRVMARSEDSCLVIRPDSGDPTETLLQVPGYPSSARLDRLSRTPARGRKHEI